MTKPLKLIAQAAADIEVVSAYLQDAVVAREDMAYLKTQRVFALVGNRYKWEDEAAQLRVRMGLRCHGVTAVQYKPLAAQAGILSLLSLTFHPTTETSPEGQLRLVFAGAGEIRLDVEACEVILEDIGEPWPARGQPHHNVDDAD
jgi:hypothetical protein